MTDRDKRLELAIHDLLAISLSIEPGALGARDELDEIGFDSLALVEFVTQVESHFDIQIDAMGLSTSLTPDLPVSELCRIVGELVNAEIHEVERSRPPSDVPAPDLSLSVSNHGV